MRFRLPLAVVLAAVASITAAFADSPSFKTVNPGTFDPAKTYLVQATWLDGIGCPTNAKTFDGTSTSSYSDPACLSGDSKDNRNQGLLLAKTGPTGNFAAAGADLKDVPRTVTELGYDIRKPGSPLKTNDPRGSHCGAGAPRFNVDTRDGKTYFIGCNSPPPTTTTPGTGWLRLRWDASTLAFPQGVYPAAALGTLDVKDISIIFDEGQDTGPDNFGVAILDNIDVNTKLVGHGPRSGDGRVTDNEHEHEHEKHKKND